MAAADLGERAARTLRDGNATGYTALYSALGIEASNDPEQDYRSGLMSAGLPYDETDAAVAAIAAWKPPDDSLTGRVEQMRADSRLGGALHSEGFYAGLSEGATAAYSSVLSLLGRKAVL
jgi:hypothetical protein